jgi:hypothetical protein
MVNASLIGAFDGQIRKETSMVANGVTYGMLDAKVAIHLNLAETIASYN